MSIVSQQRRATVNPFAMSFLDTVSAGFGASFFLFIIFASLPIEKSSGMLGSTEYIHLELEWDSKDYYLELIVEAPGQTPVRLFSSGRGDVVESPLTGKIMRQIGKKSWMEAYINGASNYGQETTENTVGGGDRLSFRATGACPGEWTFYVSIKSNDNFLLDRSYTPINVKGKLFTSAVEGVEQSFNSTFTINSYLPLGIGFNRGGQLQWTGGPDAEATAKPSIRILKGKVTESLNHCV